MQDFLKNKYFHGYSGREDQRLYEQSLILEELFHSDTYYPSDSQILEVGCGVGAQSILLARRNPKARVISFDISLESVQKARQAVSQHQLPNIRLLQADIFHLPFDNTVFDHIFVCFVLEHLVEPVKALQELKRVLKPGGSLIAIEGDHATCVWHPETWASHLVWHSMIQAQLHLHHNPLIGRQLYPLLSSAGFKVQSVMPKWVYADAGRAQEMDDVMNHIIIPMTATARDQALQLELIDSSTWERGFSDLEQVARTPNGCFFYSWFKGNAIKPDENEKTFEIRY